MPFHFYGHRSNLHCYVTLWAGWILIIIVNIKIVNKSNNFMSGLCKVILLEWTISAIYGFVVFSSLTCHINFTCVIGPYKNARVVLNTYFQHNFNLCAIWLTCCIMSHRWLRINESTPYFVFFCTVHLIYLYKRLILQTNRFLILKCLVDVHFNIFNIY